jgi:hypothetical protein
MQVLLTDKKNFLVDNEGKYGFFDENGQFLRLSDGKEWNWSAKRMRVVTHEKQPKFDLKAMAEASPVIVEEVVAQNNSTNKTFTLADLIKTNPSKNKKVSRAF